jgi:hypothetical protein
MTLDNIQLPAFIIADLFKDSLVVLNTPQPKKQEKEGAGSSVLPSVSGLGQNQRKILLLVAEKEAIYLRDDQLNFLLGILSACSLTMADVMLVNQYQHNVDYGLLTVQFEPEKILLFGVAPSAIGLPLNFPQYQVQRFNNQVYLYAPSLSVLEKDRMEKSKLWTCLKQIFNI